MRRPSPHSSQSSKRTIIEHELASFATPKKWLHPKPISKKSTFTPWTKKLVIFLHFPKSSKNIFSTQKCIFPMLFRNTSRPLRACVGYRRGHLEAYNVINSTREGELCGPCVVLHQALHWATGFTTGVASRQTHRAFSSALH